MEAVAKSTSLTSKQVSRDDLKKWYRLSHMSRLIDEQASKFIRQSKGWSYLAMCSGHEGIQLALGLFSSRLMILTMMLD